MDPLNVNATLTSGSKRRAPKNRGNKQNKGRGPKRNRGRRGRRQRGVNKIVGAFNNVAGSMTTNATRSLALQGTDVLFRKTDISTYGSNAKIVDIPIHTGLFPRLSAVAATFQRVFWLQLQVRVIMETPTTTGGGYACAFLRDATDVIPPNDEGYQRLIANQQAKVVKMWQNVSLNMPKRTDKFYTSQDVEMRWWSPARFVLMIDHPATQPTSMSIYATWRVSFTDPTLEGKSETESALIFSRSVQAQITPEDANGNKHFVLQSTTTAGAGWDLSTYIQDVTKINNEIIYKLPHVPSTITYHTSTGSEPDAEHVVDYWYVQPVKMTIPTLDPQVITAMELLKANKISLGGDALNPATTRGDQTLAIEGDELTPDTIDVNSKNMYRKAPWSDSVPGPSIFLKGLREEPTNLLLKDSKESKESSLQQQMELLTKSMNTLASLQIQSLLAQKTSSPQSEMQMPSSSKSLSESLEQQESSSRPNLSNTKAIIGKVPQLIPKGSKISELSSKRLEHILKALKPESAQSTEEREKYLKCLKHIAKFYNNWNPLVEKDSPTLSTLSMDQISSVQDPSYRLMVLALSELLQERSHLYATFLSYEMLDYNIPDTPFTLNLCDLEQDCDGCRYCEGFHIDEALCINSDCYNMCHAENCAWYAVVSKLQRSKEVCDGDWPLICAVVYIQMVLTGKSPILEYLSRAPQE